MIQKISNKNGPIKYSICYTGEPKMITNLSNRMRLSRDDLRVRKVKGKYKVRQSGVRRVGKGIFRRQIRVRLLKSKGRL